MARPLRIEYPGAYYHVMNRGNAGENIFSGSRDKEKFLEYVAKAVEQFAVVIHTYCLMSNHYHLLIETPEANLSSAIQWLNVSYAVFYNKRQNRKGHLFGGRFKAILVNADEYLSALSRYIHLNPVHANMVERPQDYPWSSYGALVGKVKRPDWLRTETLLNYFGDTVEKAINRYRVFVEDVDVAGLENPGQQATGGFVLGGDDFVKWVQQKFLVARREEKEVPELKALRPRIAVQTIVEAVCKEFGCGEEEILAKGHRGNRARAVAIFLSTTHSGMSRGNLGKFFGGISGAAITKRCHVLEKRLAMDETVRDKLMRIQKGMV